MVSFYYMVAESSVRQKRDFGSIFFLRGKNPRRSLCIRKLSERFTMKRNIFAVFNKEFGRNWYLFLNNNFGFSLSM